MIIGLFLKHIKAYKKINFIPIGTKYKFVTYVGENGVGKSSILEALDSFFNCKNYPINKSALSDGIKTSGNEPFIAPVFLINKTKITRQKKEFEKISKYFWNIDKKELHSGLQSSMSSFFNLRSQLLEEGEYSSETHYLMVVGELIPGIDAQPKPYFASFHNEEAFLLNFLDENDSILANLDQSQRKNKVGALKRQFNKILSTQDWKKFFVELKSSYSYVYFPVELDVESFTKIETTEMQKIFDKKIKNEILKSLTDVNLNKKGGINKTLENFVSQIEKILNYEYCYHTGQERNNNVTQTDLVNKILEVYFQKRILNKKTGNTLTKVSELSAGEKRQALIDLVYAFLKREGDRDQSVIIGVDEPENSLHTTLCYDQFEKLKEISDNNQVLITTHWYGFLPIISKGYGHFLKSIGNEIGFDTYDLYDYRAKVKQDVENSQNQIPANFVLKSTYDLVQSIFYSLRSDSPYNWIICEGVSEKIYFEYFFQQEIKDSNLRILPMGGQDKVIRLYKYLETPICEDKPKGKVFCLIDTDIQRCENISDCVKPKNLKIRRLSNKNSNQKTHLLKLKDPDTSPTDIEQSLDPVIFIEALRKLTDDDKYLNVNIENESGNSSFIKSFKNLELENFFKENCGGNKVKFAKVYVEETLNNENRQKFVPTWVNEIREFFN